MSTYRFQVVAEFTLHDLADVADYVHQLGVDWLYLSPLLEATHALPPGGDSDRPSMAMAGDRL